MRDLHDAIGQGRPFLDLVVDLSIRLRGIGQAASQLSKASSENLQELEVLALLERSGPPYRSGPAKLGRALNITSGALTGRLDGLARTGDLRREQDPRDRRQVWVFLTEKGHARLARARNDFEEQNLSRLPATSAAPAAVIAR
jgi:DNA-binding MarR family transcriptional regulator